MATPVPPTSEEQRAKRQAAVRNAQASLRLEGLYVDDEAAAIFHRYVEGEITMTEVAAAIHELNERDFGPIRLSLNERSSEPPRD